MQLDEFAAQFLPAVENELHSVLDIYRQGTSPAPDLDPSIPDLGDMLAYHMGWGSHPEESPARGKRIRPLITLLVNHASGGNWPSALPAASAVELIHNFSLIHDDIQDESPLRHGRPALWKKWGAAQAINAGDLMFTLAFSSILRPARGIPPALVAASGGILVHTCMDLTRGQALDLAFECTENLEIEQYWSMVAGKTSALLSASAVLGGLFANVDEVRMTSLAEFGRKLGLAYQAQDDLLGIWGEAALTGKSIESDLASRKKTLPVVYGLSKEGDFKHLWSSSTSVQGDVARMAAALEHTGAREYTSQACHRLTGEAMQALEEAIPPNDGRAALEALSGRLLGRQS